MLFSRRRVEEDLERIRKANLPAEKQAEEEKQQQAARENASRLEKGDLLAMMIAFFSVVLPDVYKRQADGAAAPVRAGGGMAAAAFSGISQPAGRHVHRRGIFRGAGAGHENSPCGGDVYKRQVLGSRACR